MNILKRGERGAPQEKQGVRELLEDLYAEFGYDFRSYKLSQLRTHLKRVLRAEQKQNLNSLKEAVFSHAPIRERLIAALSVEESPLFDDESFYRNFRERVIPWLKTFPSVRIWVAGCGRGGVVYSLATVLQEEGIQRYRIYATDVSELHVKKSQRGAFPVSEFQSAMQVYENSGGRFRLADYGVFEPPDFVFDERVRSRLFFFHHNLVTDGSFNEFQIIIFKNVMSFFEAKLKNRVLRSLTQSLSSHGLLCLGKDESLKGTAIEADFRLLADGSSIYKRIP